MLTASVSRKREKGRKGEREKGRKGGRGEEEGKGRKKKEGRGERKKGRKKVTPALVFVQGGAVAVVVSVGAVLMVGLE